MGGIRVASPEPSISTPEPPLTTHQATDEISLVSLANVLLRSRRTIVRWVGGGFLLGIAWALLTPRTWTSHSSFQPQSSGMGGDVGQLAGLAAQFGVQLPQQGQAQSPDFYVALLDSREILARAGARSYGAASDSEPLSKYYGIDGDAPALTEAKVVRRLAGDIDAQVDIKTGVIHLSVRAKSAELAHQLNAALLDLLNDFNLRTRQSQARAERVFAEQRLGEVRDSLRAAEDRLQGFMQRNRDFRNSPELSFQQDRLVREVALQQGVAQTLLQAYEQAKLQEVRDIPVLTIVEQPEFPPRPDGRGLTKKPFLLALLGAFISILIAIARELGAGLQTASGPEFVELRTLLAATRVEMERIRGRFRRRPDR